MTRIPNITKIKTNECQRTADKVPKAILIYNCINVKRIYGGAHPFKAFFDFRLRASRYAKKILLVLSRIVDDTFINIFNFLAFS